MTHSVVFLVTRVWTNLDKPGIALLPASPKTSDGAKWSFLPLLGAITNTGENEAKASQFIE